MKRLAFLAILSVLTAIPIMTKADSFGFYYRSDGFGMGMNFGHYDYYDRYAPGFYEQNNIDFYNALDPYGYWEYLDDFDGYIWIPRVSVDWRPYSYGSWIFTSHGWTWVAYEPWGWIPHHYGRWFFHNARGWLWVPDSNGTGIRDLGLSQRILRMGTYATGSLPVL